MTASARINLLATACWVLTAAHLAGQPKIITQPTDQSVSLGITVRFSVSATGSPPLAYQWWFKEAAIDAATNTYLLLTNVTLAQAGSYWAVVSDANGSVTSRVAQLSVDPTAFTKITVGRVATDSEGSEDLTWWDYDNDGYLDLFVANATISGGVANSLYHNNGDGTFTKITNNPIVTLLNGSWYGAVGDYNNDGNLDLFVEHYNGPNDLFRNDGGGRFTRLTSSQCGPVVSDSFSSFDGGWADYDRDGFIDLFTANGYNVALNDCLYRNNGDGTFTKMTTNEVGVLVNDKAIPSMCSWADYDNDGYPDLFVENNSGMNWLYHNEGNGTFRKITEGSIVAQGSTTIGVWADYNNDGFLDLFVLGGRAGISLHHNLGGLTFTNVAPTAGLVYTSEAWYAAWGDYDNDGFLDLFIVGYSAPSVLYHNNGNGTFTSVDIGSPLRDGSRRCGVAWADYDNDGFLDLSIACGDTLLVPNLLYHNNGNSNRWLKVTLIGTASNRAAMGAKVRVQATIRGQTFWQMREISGNSGHSAGQGLIAHFGLGDATKVTTLRIEWPSGMMFNDPGAASRPQRFYRAVTK